MMTEMKKMKTLTLQGVPFEVVDEAARNEIEDVKETLNSLPKNEVATPDLAQNDPSAPDYVKNRTHYEETTVVNEPLNITWDGNTEGLVSVINDTDEGTFGFYKVSNDVFSDEQIKKMEYTYYENDDGDEYNETFNIGNKWDGLIANGSVSTDIVACYEFIMFVRKAGATWNDFTFPECGMYFAKGTEGDFYEVHVTSLTTTEPVEHTKTVVKKLDKKYLPDDIGGGITTLYANKNDDDYVYLDEMRTTKATKEDIDSILSNSSIRIMYGNTHWGENAEITQLVSISDEENYYRIGYVYVSQYNDMNTNIMYTAEYVSAPPM